MIFIQGGLSDEPASVPQEYSLALSYDVDHGVFINTEPLLLCEG